MKNITVVCTGASGYASGEIVKQLLEKGYDVRGTVRSTANKEKISHLTALDAALPGKLTLYEADLMKPGSFDEVVKGADYVIHTASPFQPDIEDPQKNLIEPAVQGTRNVLKSVAKSKDTIKLTVVTSSFAAVVCAESGPPDGKLYNEKVWNKDSTLETDAYSLSKTLAEKEAWKIAKEEGLELATINPTLVMGPVLSAREDATSIILLKKFLEGSKEDFYPWLCDVRDIGRAHVLAIENKAAKGKRFIVSVTETADFHSLSDAVKSAFPGIQVPDLKQSKPEPFLDNTQALNVLGLHYLHDPKVSFVDMARTLIQKGVAKPTFK